MGKYTKFVTGLIKYMNGRMSPQEAIEKAQALLKERVERREENFLNLIRKSVYEYPKSPYLKLLKSSKDRILGHEEMDRARRPGKGAGKTADGKGSTSPLKSTRERWKSSATVSVSC